MAAHTQSLVFFHDRVRRYPRNALHHRNLAPLLERQGKHAEAEKHLLLATLVAPQDAFSRNDYGLALLRRGRVDEAIEELQRAVLLNDHAAILHKNIAAAYAKKGTRHLCACLCLFDRSFLPGQIQLALDHCRKALEMDSRDPQTHRNIAKLYESRGDSRRALEHNMKATTLAYEQHENDLQADADAHRNIAVQIVSRGLREATADAQHKYMDTARVITSSRFYPSTTTTTQDIISLIEDQRFKKMELLELQKRSTPR
jgi:tetratricopeptide (TPR) repeat protein